MNKLYLTAFLDLEAEVPGWYVSVNSDEGSYISPLMVAENSLAQFGLAFERVLETNPQAPEIRITDLVNHGTDQIRNALKEQLEDAERAAAKIPALRHRLGAQSVTPPRQATSPRPLAEIREQELRAQAGMQRIDNER